MSRDVFLLGTALALLSFSAARPESASGGPGLTMEPDPESREHAVTVQRKGAGIRIGHWAVTGLPESSGIEKSQAPLLEGFFQKGLDLHLALETTVALWRWSRETSQTNLLGETSRETIRAYVIPSFTSIKFHPFTRPSDRLEPFLLGGVGFVLGIEDGDRSGSDLGLVAEPGTRLQLGAGFKLGTGVAWRFSSAFSATTGVRYQWVRFFESFAGLGTYRGFGVDMGLTYRFQYD